MFSIILYMNNRKPSDYYKIINDLDSQFVNISKEINNSYPYFKTYPNIKKYVVNYENDIKVENKIKSDLFVLKNELQKNIQDREDIEQTLMRDINKYDNDNKKLKTKLNQLKNQNKGAIGFYSNTQNNYNVVITKSIFFFIVMLSIILYIKYNINVYQDVSILVTGIVNESKDNITDSLKDVGSKVEDIMTNLNDLINDIISNTTNLVNKAIQNIGLSNECVNNRTDNIDEISKE